MTTACDTSSLRRGWCPALSAPMQTGDGWLSRIALHDAISPAQLTEIARLSALHGNSVIDISARGNLQLRGLTPETAQMLEADVRKLDLPLREGLAVETGPLAGLDAREVTDPRPIADAIRAAADNLRHNLAPKMTVVVDGGGQISLDTLLADIRLTALGHDIWRLDTGTFCGHVTAGNAAEVALEILRMLGGMGKKARGRDLDAGAVLHTVKHRLVDPPAIASSPQKATWPFIPLRKNMVATRLVLPFGQCNARDLAALCGAAITNGIALVRPAPGHALLFIGTQAACTALLSDKTSGGFITSPTDPRQFIATCPGAPACASAAGETRGIAQEIAARCGTLLDGSFTLHVSGCAKGCAHPTPAAVTLSALENGRIGLAYDASAGDAPLMSFPAGEAVAAIGRLAKLVQISRIDKETSASCIARLGAAGLEHIPEIRQTTVFACPSSALPGTFSPQAGRRDHAATSLPPLPVKTGRGPG